MAEVTIDSYSESNGFGNQLIGSNAALGMLDWSQSITGTGKPIERLVYYMYRNGNPTGNLYAKIYAHTGVFGTSSLPTGAPLATSDPVSVTSLSVGGMAYVNFNFSGAQRIDLTNATKYVIVIDASAVSIDASNYTVLAVDPTAPAHPGNAGYFDTSWHADNTFDVIFYLYGTDTPAVATVTPTTIGSGKITMLGRIDSLGGGTVDEAGFVYSTTSHAAPGFVAPNLSGYESKISTIATFSTGSYSQQATGLTPNTGYYIRAYAHNASGYAYGDEVYVATSLLTTVTFSATDPTLMWRSIIDSYVSRGGVVNYSGGTSDLTGLSLTYTFNTATVLDGFNACLSMAPSDWYWYVDVGTNTAYFKETATTPTHKLVAGRHIADLNLVMTIENLKNILYFTGGNVTTTTNLFKIYQNAASVAAYGPRIALQTDNRVTRQDTADAIGNSFINSHKDPNYQTVVDIIDGTYDTTLFKPGDVVGLYGFGNFIEGLKMQIVQIKYTPDLTTLVLGTMPRRAITSIEQMRRDLIAIQTEGNPVSPS